MWFTKQTDGFLAWFTLSDKDGLILTGAVGGDFTVTVVTPADDASNSPTVSESSTKAGLYTFLVPSSFITTNGVGIYGVVVELIKTTSPKLNDVISSPLLVSGNDFDTIGDNTVLIPAIL